MKKHLFFLLALTVFLGTKHGFAQITIAPNQTAAQLAQKLTGTGVVVINPTLNCPLGASGSFSGISSVNMDSGIVLTSGQVMNGGITIGIPNPGSAFASTSNNAAGDAQLSALAQVNTNDACILEFDFIPAGDTIKFDYVFGSEEYPEYACATVNDIFGFFISGPGIVGAPDIALVPGTNIPVTVNTVNPGAGAFGTLSNCTAFGPGSPFAAYYVDNSLSTTIVYDGLTTMLQAISAVTPCDTYHLKLAIADGGDFVFDSGVFLKAGSLSSNTISISPIGASNLSNPTPYCVRGCEPGQFIFKRQVPRPTPLTIKYQIAGTAINGVDYVQIPDSIIIPANDTIAIRFIQGLVQPTAQPVENVLLRIYNPYTCGTAANPSFLDSASLDIRDSFFVQILTPDTAICIGESVNIFAVGDTSLDFSWSPAATISPTNTLNTTASPTSTTTYVLTASLAGSGCPPSHDQITVTIKPQPIVNAGPDTSICLGKSYLIPTQVSPTNVIYTYSWTPITGLSNPTIANPVASPTADVSYVVKVNSGAIGCDGFDTVNIRVLPNSIDLLNQDTAICKGASVPIRLVGDSRFTYSWQPTNGVVLPNQAQPLITPDTTTTYTVVASYPGCDNMIESVTIDVQPNPIVDIGPDRVMCQFDTLHFEPIISPAWYNNYSYSWNPGTDIKPAPNQRDIYFDGSVNTVLVLTVTTPAGCLGADDASITVYPGNFASIDPPSKEICPNDSVLVNLSGGVSYIWTPKRYLSDTIGSSVIVKPNGSTYYTIYATNDFGCRDTLKFDIRVFPAALLSLQDSLVIYPGESVQLQPQGNGLYFTWFPQNYLSNSSIANPTTTPPVSTRYFVTTVTENGCVATDSIDIIVDPSSYIELPNAFAPGGGENGKFTILKRGVASLRYFRIFNRWGQQVFTTSDFKEGWDGTFNGTSQPMGVYIWTVEAQLNDGTLVKKQGNVTLIR